MTSKLSEKNQAVLERQLDGVTGYPAQEARYILETFGAGMSQIQVDRVACAIVCAYKYGFIAGQADAMEIQDAFKTYATESPVPEVTTDTNTIVNFDAPRQK